MMASGSPTAQLIVALGLAVERAGVSEFQIQAEGTGSHGPVRLAAFRS